jgi:undecaprenyl phosphate-alpha-L-ara4N flippase subunit ArnE
MMTISSKAALIPWLSLVGSIVIGAGAQVSLKYGTNSRKNVTGTLSRYLSPWVGLWAAGFVAATLLWLIALAYLDLSYAYPMLGLSYVLVTGMAAFILKEPISRLHWIAVLMIGAGAACIARSGL